MTGRDAGTVAGRVPLAGRWARPGVRRRTTVGDVVATYLPDGYVQLEPARWFSLPDAGPVAEHPDLLDAHGHLVASIGVLLLEGPGWRLLVDAGLGPAHVPASATHASLGVMVGGGLVEHAGEIGAVDAVVVTHAHDDHVGWARAGWPGFAGLARVPHLVGAGERAPSGWGVLRDGDEVVPGVRVLATPGHTHGHVSLVVDGGAGRLLVAGDVLHSPVQVPHPGLGSCFDVDPGASARSRARVLAELAVPGTVGAVTHFADVPFGVVRDGRWVPLPDGD
ncbi:hypothetical protein GCM10023113_11330 [Cellulomonas oligotrophica]|uniref:Metallo-beta-lactamase domain-containing protein n=1 Tax=Cellulomonas oligotrophica TaxID=931536 RepID=A0ABQ4D7X1_9CELL|nr:hypothetical protein Col01nite_09800 [Cellulomonas oligotrophica]